MGHAVMAAFGADGVTVQQFNEAAGGQEVFHLHYHVLPRHEATSCARRENRKILACSRPMPTRYAPLWDNRLRVFRAAGGRGKCRFRAIKCLIGLNLPACAC